MSLSISKAALVSNNMKQFPADLVTSAEEKLMEKFIFRAVLRDLSFKFVFLHPAKRRRSDVLPISLCSSQKLRRNVSIETPNDVSMERHHDISVVRRHDILLERCGDVSRGRNNNVSSVRLHDVSNKSQMKHLTTSHWYITKTSQWYVSMRSH